MTCGECAKWDLRSSFLRAHGFGLCKAERDPLRRVATTKPEANVCTIGKFEQAGAVTMARREQEKARAK